jgi:hypothetical protein
LPPLSFREDPFSRRYCVVSQTFVFVTLFSPTAKPPVYAYGSVTKLIPKSKYQNLTNSMSFDTLFTDT